MVDEKSLSQNATKKGVVLVLGLRLLQSIGMG
jgi:hypothetical protein